MEMEQGDVVLCRVEKIIGTTVFVNIDGADKQGTIIMSEVAAGRIRNLRDYVVPKKTIVCKILRIMNDHIELSLRRTSKKEHKEMLSKHKLEKSYTNVLKTCIKDQSNEIISQIKEKNSLYDFLENAKTDPTELNKLVTKEESEMILKILLSQKKKTKSLKKEIKLSTTRSDGLSKIKELLSTPNLKIKYLSGGKYSIEAQNEDLKKADQEISTFIEHLTETAKKEGLDIRL